VGSARNRSEETISGIALPTTASRLTSVRKK
jgi:hypothetical protein